VSNYYIVLLAGATPARIVPWVLKHFVFTDW